MKFSCNRVQLSEAVTNVQRAVSSKAAIPALEGIFITAKGDQLTLVGYDLDIAIETTIDSFITEEGRAILNARLLGDILRKAEGEHVNIEVDQKFGAKIYAESSHFEIMGIDPNEYPKPRILRLIINYCRAWYRKPFSRRRLRSSNRCIPVFCLRSKAG